MFLGLHSGVHVADGAVFKGFTALGFFLLLRTAAVPDVRFSRKSTKSAFLVFVRFLFLQKFHLINGFFFVFS